MRKRSSAVIVPAGQTWTITEVIAYAYQTGATTAPINGASLRIWDGSPDNVASSVIFGDRTTNRLTATVEAMLYRVFNTVVPPATAPGITRRIWRNTIAVAAPLVVPAGTYWVDFQFTLGLGAALFCPPNTVPGVRALPGGNSLQFQETTAVPPPGAWFAVIDVGQPTTAPDFPLDAPFELEGSCAGSGCPGAAPALTVDPATIPYGSVTTGTTAGPTLVTVTNDGSALATISSIALTAANPEVTVNTTGTDFTLNPTQATTFTISWSPLAAGPLSATVAVASDDPGSPDNVTLTGTAVPPGGPTVYPSTDTPLTLPDSPSSTTSTLTVPAGAPNILDLDVDLNITHTWVGDFIITLTHDALVSSIMMDRAGTTTVPAGVGCSSNNMNLFVDDEGSTGSLEAACIGVASTAEAYTADGRYTPNNPLTVFDGMSAVGAWTLTISDNAGGDTGTLNSWALLVTPNPVATGPGAGEAATRLTVAPNPVVGSGQVELAVATAQDVRVALYDALGREVRVLYEGRLAAGQVALVGFPTAGLAPGAYVVRATGTDLRVSQRVTVAR